MQLAAVKRVKRDVFFIAVKTDISPLNRTGKDFRTAVTVKEENFQVMVAHRLSGKEGQQSGFTLSGRSDNATVGHSGIFG